MAERPRVSVVILAKNEASRIAQCLECVRWADDIIVVDDMSTDQTAEIARRYGAKVVKRPFDDFASQANFGLTHATGEWVLSLDADERVTPQLQDEIQAVLREPSDHVGYTFRRLNFFLGHCMRHGGWHHNTLHLFRRDAGSYVGKVHYAPDVRGRIGHLDADVERYPFQSLTQFIGRQNRYTSVEADALRAEIPTLSECALRYQLSIRPVKLFWKSYVKKGGWREGMYGLVFAALYAWCEFLKWAKWWERSLHRDSSTTCQGDRAAQGEVSEPAARVPHRAPGQKRLSVVVLTKNEEGKIARCLRSVRWADEIIVVDGLSEDRTREICEGFGATVISHAFDGSFATDRNLGLDHAHGDWVLQIDADDIVTPEFHAAVEALLRDDLPYAALTFRRRSVLLGRVMRYGGWYYSVPNLLRRGRARYEGLVHERPVLEGVLGALDADIEHHPCEDIAVFVARHNRYTSLQAGELFAQRRVIPVRELYWRMWRRPWKTFWKSYVKKQGYREGLHGLVFAALFAGIELMKWAKYWECGYVPRQQDEATAPPPIPEVTEPVRYRTASHQSPR